MTVNVAVGRVRPDQAHRGVGGGREPGGDLDRDPSCFAVVRRGLVIPTLNPSRGGL